MAFLNRHQPQLVVSTRITSSTRANIRDLLSFRRRQAGLCNSALVFIGFVVYSQPLATDTTEAPNAKNEKTKGLTKTQLNTTIMLCRLRRYILIPKFEKDGNLPPGIHEVTWGEFATKFGANSHRAAQVAGLERAIQKLRQHGCTTIFVDGSFASDKDLPGDYDIAWDPTNVDLNALFSDEPAFFDFTNYRTAQKAKFGGEFFPSSATEASVGKTFLEFFQEDKNTGAPKGIVKLNI